MEVISMVGESQKAGLAIFQVKCKMLQAKKEAASKEAASFLYKQDLIKQCSERRNDLSDASCYFLAPAFLAFFGCG
ncbi:hypothetical protein PCS_02931 [Desulfocurvibacter africanus PCS]|uniref:Uncharacterized protein n=1 Tax=Desulfocurvibacter africanus PCS TaxID=1262666 RepID=M5Q061_DESAF|nr:hypothetical protein PCS_02931 [Desulfocurvibacter africanus PCS]